MAEKREEIHAENKELPTETSPSPVSQPILVTSPPVQSPTQALQTLSPEEDNDFMMSMIQSDVRRINEVETACKKYCMYQFFQAIFQGAKFSKKQMAQMAKKFHFVNLEDRKKHLNTRNDHLNTLYKTIT